MFDHSPFYLHSHLQPITFIYIYSPFAFTAHFNINANIKIKCSVVKYFLICKINSLLALSIFHNCCFYGTLFKNKRPQAPIFPPRLKKRKYLLKWKLYFETLYRLFCNLYLRISNRALFGEILCSCKDWKIYC